MSSNNSPQFDTRQYPSETARLICEEILPEWKEMFLRKNMDYGDFHITLGIAGQFVDMWRKIGKIRRSLWEGKPLVGEQPDEVLFDLAAHCFLAALEYRRGNTRGDQPTLGPAGARPGTLGDNEPAKVAAINPQLHPW